VPIASKKCFGFSRRGMYFTFLNLPSGAKAQDFLGLPCGTAKAVPFQNMNFLNFHVHAIAHGNRSYQISM
jgi:hypothetical protein